MILNPSKCHCMVLGGHTQMDHISLNGIEVKSSRNETLLGVIFESDLKFDAHIKSQNRKDAQKLSALSETNKYFTYY